MQTAHWILHGRVQGVFCRAETKRAALKLDIAGYVRNLADGTVEVVAQAETKEKLLEFKAALKALDPPIHVENISGNISEDSAPGYAGFSISY